MYEKYFKITDQFKFAAEKTGRELKAETTENRHQTMDFNCFAKRNMYNGFIYPLLLNVVIGFGYCNHYNLIFRWAEKRFVYVWFGMDCGERVFINKV